MGGLKQTPLYETHVAAGARMVPFGGFSMPVQYVGINQEHRAVRSQAGLFDVSHMGEIEVRGAGALSFLRRMLTNDASRVAIGQTQYTLLCNEAGGVIDDLLLYRLAEESYLLVVNAANTEKDFAWLKAHQTADVSLTDVSAQYALLALQGPQAAQLLQPLTAVPLAELKPNWFVQGVTVAGSGVAILSRTGYTGEDGFELYCAPTAAIPLWQALTAAGATPAGLGARDTLRLEARFPLYGQELGPEITPLEAGLGFFVKFGRGFIGEAALAAQKMAGVSRRLVGFELLERGIARAGYPLSHGGQVVGQVTSGTQSPTLEKAIGLGFLPPGLAKPGTEIEVQIRGKGVAAQVVPTPFYKREV